MKNTNRKTNRGTRKARRAAALLAAVMAATTMTGICASAEEPISVTFSFTRANLSDNQKLDFETARERLDIMRKKVVKFKLRNDGDCTFKLNSSKVYGRRAIGVYKDGSYILGNWELLDEVSNDIMRSNEFKITGDYVVLGYSPDICRGTDFPYSGIFWDATKDRFMSTELNEAEIIIGGTAYNIDVMFTLSLRMQCDGFKDTHTFSWQEVNCDDHEEWEPENLVINPRVKE